MKKEELIQGCEGILKLELDAKALYESYLGEIENEAVKKTLNEIIQDETRHIEIAKEMLALLK